MQRSLNVCHLDPAEAVTGVNRRTQFCKYCGKGKQCLFLASKTQTEEGRSLRSLQQTVEGNQGRLLEVCLVSRLLPCANLFAQVKTGKSSRSQRVISHIVSMCTRTHKASSRHQLSILHIPLTNLVPSGKLINQVSR